MADRDDFSNPIPHQAPKKTVVDAVLDGAIKAGSSAVSLLSGLLAAVLILYSSYVLYDTMNVERSAFSSAWDLLQFKPELIEDNGGITESPPLSEINQDYRAWLTVYDTNIDYPVMQGPNDLYYASHDVYHHPSLTGAIYLAAGNSPDFSDTYNVLYGHHMDNGAMFGGLDQFIDGGYFGAHRTGTVITPNGAFDIEFFAVASTDAYESQIYSTGNRAEDVVGFLAGGGAGGVGLGTTVHHFDAAVAATADRVIALSTCAAADGTNGRLVVFGKMSEHIVYTSLTVTKVWDDNDNQDGIRAKELKVRLTSGGETVRTVTLTAENNWTATVDNIPAYRSWTPIAYSWEEDDTEGYTQTGNVTEETVTTLTNRHVPETTALTVTKVWNDDNNRDGLRPESLTVTLSNGDTVVLTEENNWTATIAGLPVNRDGQPITYTWTEEDRDGYTSASSVSGAVTTLTNTHEIETTDLTVKKVWKDSGTGDRPATLRMTLTGSGGETRQVTLSADNNWTATVTGLPRYDNGREINYSWSEPSISGYEQTSVSTTGTTTVFTNTRKYSGSTVKKYTLTIHYRYPDGTTAAPDYTGTYKKDSRYSVDSPEIEGYVAMIGRVTGVMPGHDMEYIVIYLPLDEIVHNDRTGTGPGRVILNVGDCLE